MASLQDVLAIAARKVDRMRSLRASLSATSLLVVLILGACSEPFEPQVTGSMSVTPTGQSVAVGESVSLFATGRASDGGPYAMGSVTWSSSDPSIAVVASSRVSDVLGLGTQVTATVRGVAAGSVTITASSGRAGSASAQVTVTS